MITAIVLIDCATDSIPEVAEDARHPARGQRGLLRRRQRRPDRDGAGAAIRGDRRGHRRAASRRSPGVLEHRVAHRVPGLLPARPGRGVRDRAAGTPTEPARTRKGPREGALFSSTHGSAAGGDLLALLARGHRRHARRDRGLGRLLDREEEALHRRARARRAGSSSSARPSRRSPAGCAVRRGRRPARAAGGPRRTGRPAGAG